MFTLDSLSKKVSEMTLVAAVNSSRTFIVGLYNGRVETITGEMLFTLALFMPEKILFWALTTS